MEESLTRGAIREPAADTPEQYSQRIYYLAAIYAVIFVSSCTGVFLLVNWGKLFVTLSQRSNVETLIVFFFVLFYLYFIFLSWRGTRAAFALAYFFVLGRFKSVQSIEDRKAKAMGTANKARASAALNVILEREGEARSPFRIRMADEYGSLGYIEIDGVKLTHRPDRGRGSVNSLVYLVHQANQLIHRREVEVDLNIVEWQSISDEGMDRYLGLVQFARNVERALEVDQMWPKVCLLAGECVELEDRLSKICRAVRNESFLPDWEYSGEHKLPLIPEPLGLFSLGRSEDRVDPISSMGTAAIVVLATVVVFALFVVFPPWVPG